MKISNFFNLEGPMDFVDVDSSGDTRVFLQAPLVRHRAIAGDPWGVAASDELDSFTIKVFDLVLDEPPKREECLRLFERFGEAHSIRLGYAKKSRSGNGSGEKLSEALYDALSAEDRFLVEYGGFAHVEEAMTFVPQMGVDRVSDMVAQIMMGTLIDYTVYQIGKHPRLAEAVRPAKFTVWDSNNSTWTTRVANVPHIHSNPLILVPASWTAKSLEFSIDRVIGRGICRALQAERTTVDGNGKLVRPSIKKLRKEIPAEPRKLLRYLRHLARRDLPIDALARRRHFLTEWFDQRQAA